jgi:serine/threonine-protein kinase RsbW
VIHKIHLQVNTDLAATSQVMSWFEQINSPPLSDLKTWWQCQTLLQEGFANIVEHAHKNLPPETPIVLEAIRSEQAIEIRIWSYGTAFDLQQKLREIPEFENNDGDRGRGLKIMSKLADGLSYESTADNRYCLWMKKYYEF